MENKTIATLTVEVEKEERQGVNKKGNYTVTEKCLAHYVSQVKFSKYEITNKLFTKALQVDENGKAFIQEKSLPMYKSSVIQIEEFTGKCITEITPEEIETYVMTKKSEATKKTQRTCIRGFIKFWLQYVGIDATTKEMLFYLVF